MIRERIIETERPSIGLVVGTYSAVPYVHLHLESWKRNYSHIPILVHDDASPDGEKIRALCEQYGTEFVSTPSSLGHSLGDLSVFLEGFDWAQERDLDLLVKMSRRFTPVIDWTPELQDLAYRTQYATYGNHCTAQSWGLRTECVALHVRSWVASGAVDDIRRQVIQGHNDGCIEAVIHRLARGVHISNCAHNRRYEKARPKSLNYAGYGDWKFLSSSRDQKMPDALWHHYSSCEPIDYCRTLRQYGVKYSVSSFNDVNGEHPAGMLAQHFEEAKQAPPNDIGEHLGTLARLAAECGHVTELGTRGGLSTTALLYAWPETLITYDLDYQHDLGHLEQAAREMGVEFEAVHADVLAVEIEKTDLLFIDTLHTYDQLRQELALHADKVRKYLVFHDTTTYGFRGEADGTVGLWPAITEFLSDHSEWELAEKHEHNNGLTVLQRCESKQGIMALSELAEAASPNEIQSETIRTTE